MAMYIHRFLDTIKNIFLHGFFTLLPLILTTTIFIFIIRSIISWIKPFHKFVPHIIQHIPYSEFFIGIIFIFCLGIILKYLFLLPLFHLFESLLGKIPMIRSVYFGIKQLVHAFTASDSNTFKEVVIIEYPRKKLYSLGFLTGKQHPNLIPNTDKKYFHVYVPHVPNPTVGYFLLVAEDELKHTSLSRQDALALIISGGIVTSDKI